MIRLFLTVFIMSAASVSFAATEVVNSYYDYIKRLKTRDYNEAIDIQSHIMECFFINKKDKEEGFSGVNVADWLTGEEEIASNLYAQRLTNYIYHKRELSLDDYSITEYSTYNQPAAGKSDQAPILTASVNLVITHKGVRLPVRREKLYITDNLIWRISTISDGRGSDSTPDSRHVTDEDDISWTIKAAEYYTRKQHKEAYAAYKKAVEINPHNMNALYRLGVMTIQGKGIKKSVSDAKTFFERVLAADSRKNNSIWGTWQLRKQAENAIYLINHPPI